MTKSDKHWQYTGDINPLDYGGKWYRRVTGRQYQVIELTNMEDACGRDNAGRDTYVVELSLVDLDAIPAAEQESALESCGYDAYDVDSNARDAMTAIACYEYGYKAPLDSWSGNGSSKLLRAARSAAHALASDAAELEERLVRPVNKIGSTAAEYMTGDLNSAILRGVSEGRPDAELMFKLGVAGRK